MADTYSDRSGLILMEEGTHTNEWGDLTNLNLDRLDVLTRGYIKITLSGAETLDSNDITTTGTTAQEDSFFRFIEFAGTGGTVTVPAQNIMWIVRNSTGGDFTFKPAGGTGVTLVDGRTHIIVYGANGTTFTDVSDELNSSAVVTLTGTQELTNKTLASPALTTPTLTTPTLTSPVINTGVSGNAFLDDDSFATATDSTLTSSESIKAYADTKQTLDAGLTSIAGLTTAADKMIYTDGSDSYVVIPLTSAGRAILDDADASAQRTTLGLVIGTDVQALITGSATTIDTEDLTANRAVISNGSQKIAVSAVTSTELGYLDGVSSAIQTQLGTKGDKDTAQAWTKGQRGEITALSDGATITPDMDDSNNFSVTLAGDRTLANPSNLTAGQSGCIFITQDGTGTRTLGYGTYWDFAGGTDPVLTTTAAAVDVLSYVVRSPTSIVASLIGDIK